jgi:superfamily II DNA helicase RecQ
MPPPLYSREDIDRAVRAAAQEMGYSKLRENQETVVKTFLQCRDVFVSLPTGSGKSLCYCILPLVFDKIKRKETESIAVVVSPLIALMKDQVMGMTRRNVSAECVHSELYQLLHASEAGTAEKALANSSFDLNKSRGVLNQLLDNRLANSLMIANLAAILFRCSSPT